MKQKLFFLFMAIATNMQLQAQTKLILHQKGGANIEIAFSDKPIATFEEGNMVITTEKTTLLFPISSLGTFSYEDGITTAIIESVTQLSSNVGPSRIYDTSGRLLMSIPAGEPINLGTLTEGLYIIKNNNSSYKINKK